MLEETELYRMLMRVKTGPNDDQVWIECFTQDLRREIIRLIQEDQLTQKGIDEAGEIIGYYSYLTELITNGRKQEGDHFDLNDTGDFYRSMFVTPLRDGFVIDANSSSFREMQSQDWYSDGILGLTDENLQQIIEKIKDRYRGQIQKLLFGSI